MTILRSRPSAAWGAFAGLLTGAGTLALVASPIGLPWLWAYLLSITAVTFVGYGWDKRAARHGRARVPERVLLGFACVGGTLGAIAGMRVFRHKTAKPSFVLRLVLLVALQFALVLLWLRWR